MLLCMQPDFGNSKFRNQQITDGDRNNEDDYKNDRNDRKVKANKDKFNSDTSESLRTKSGKIPETNNNNNNNSSNNSSNNNCNREMDTSNTGIRSMSNSGNKGRRRVRTVQQSKTQLHGPEEPHSFPSRQTKTSFSNTSSSHVPHFWEPEFSSSFYQSYQSPHATFRNYSSQEFPKSLLPSSIPTSMSHESRTTKKFSPSEQPYDLNSLQQQQHQHQHHEHDHYRTDRGFQQIYNNPRPQSKHVNYQIPEYSNVQYGIDSQGKGQLQYESTMSQKYPPLTGYLSESVQYNPHTQYNPFFSHGEDSRKDKGSRTLHTQDLLLGGGSVHEGAKGSNLMGKKTSQTTTNTPTTNTPTTNTPTTNTPTVATITTTTTTTTADDNIGSNSSNNRITTSTTKITTRGVLSTNPNNSNRKQKQQKGRDLDEQVLNNSITFSYDFVLDSGGCGGGGGGCGCGGCGNGGCGGDRRVDGLRRSKSGEKVSCFEEVGDDDKHDNNRDEDKVGDDEITKQCNVIPATVTNIEGKGKFGTNNRPSQQHLPHEKKKKAVIIGKKRERDTNEDVSKEKRKKPGKRKLVLSRKDLERHFHVSQSEAAKNLGVSVSTLKRRFYEIFAHQRWPYHYTGNHQTISPSPSSDDADKSNEENEVLRKGVDESNEEGEMMDGGHFTAEVSSLPKDQSKRKQKNPFARVQEENKVLLSHILNQTHCDEKCIEEKTLQFLLKSFEN